MLVKSQILQLIDEFIQKTIEAEAEGRTSFDLGASLQELNQSDFKQLEEACLEALDRYELPHSLVIAHMMLELRGNSPNLNKALNVFSAAINSGDNGYVIGAVGMIANMRNKKDELIDIVEQSYANQSLEIKLALAMALLSRSSPTAMEAIQLVGKLMANPEVDPMVRMIYAASFINAGLREAEAWELISLCLKITEEPKECVEVLVTRLDPSVRIGLPVLNVLLTLLPQLEEGNLLRSKLIVLLGKMDDPSSPFHSMVVGFLSNSYGSDFSAAFEAILHDSKFSDKYLPLLIDRLEQDNVDGRLLVACHLVQAGRLTLTTNDAARLVNCLNAERDIVVVEHLIYALTKCDESIVPHLLSIIKETSYIRMLLFALPLIQVGDSTRLAILDYIANNPHENMALVLKLIFLENSIECPEELEKYGELLVSPDDQVARNMLICLQSVGPGGKPLIPYLIQLIVSDDNWRKDKAINVLASIGLDVLPYLESSAKEYGELPVFEFVRSKIELSANKSGAVDLGFIEQRQFLVTFTKIGDAFDALGKVGLRKVSEFIKSKVPNANEVKSYSPANLKKTLLALNQLLSQRWNRNVQLFKVEHGTTLLTTEGLRFLKMAKRYLEAVDSTNL